MADIQFDGVKLSVAFSQAASLANIASGENISTSFGKLSKFIASIQDLVSTGTPINGNIDLNDYTTNGIYTTAATVGTITNGPTITAPDENNKFTLLVLNNDADPTLGEYTAQIIVYPIGNTSNFNSEIYCRCRLSVSGIPPVWGSWYRIFPTQLDSSITQNGSNPVAGSTIYSALSGKQDSLVFDGTYDSSTNKVALESSILNDVFGVGTLLTSSDNLNSLSSDGVYYYTGTSVPTNTPAGARATLIQFSNTDTSCPTQIVIPYAKTGMVFYIRRKSDAWGDWRTFECIANYDTAPTTGSSSAVTSDGIVTALAKKLSFGGSATLLTNSDNLNDVRTEGSYYWLNSSYPTNRPKQYGTTGNNVTASIMYVSKLGTEENRIQIVIPINSTYSCVYLRYIYNTNIGDWKALQPISEFDTKPTNNSVRGVTSGGVFNATGGIGTSIADYTDLDTLTTPGRYYKSSNAYYCPNAPLNGYEPGQSKGIGALQLTVEYNAAASRLVQTATYSPSHSTSGTNYHPSRESIACGHFWKRWLIPIGTPAGSTTTITGWTPWYQFDGDEPILEIPNIVITNDNTVEGVSVEIKGINRDSATINMGSTYLTYTVTHVPTDGTVLDRYILNVKSKGTYTGAGMNYTTSATTTYNGAEYKIYFNIRLNPAPEGTNEFNPPDETI